MESNVIGKAHITSIKYPKWNYPNWNSTYNQLTKSPEPPNRALTTSTTKKEPQTTYMLETPTLESRCASPSLQVDQLPTSEPSCPHSNA